MTNLCNVRTNSNIIITSFIDDGNSRFIYMFYIMCVRQYMYIPLYIRFILLIPLLLSPDHCLVDDHHVLHQFPIRR